MDQDNSGQPQAPKAPQPVMDIQRPSRNMNDMVAPAPSTVQQPQAQPQATQPNMEAQEVGVPSYDQQHVALNKQVKKKRRGVIVIIIITMIITIGLIGAAGYAYWRSMSDDSATEQSQTTTETATDTTGIDSTTAEIDEALDTLDDSADFNSDDLSDDGIGL